MSTSKCAIRVARSAFFLLSALPLTDGLSDVPALFQPLISPSLGKGTNVSIALHYLTRTTWYVEFESRSSDIILKLPTHHFFSEFCGDALRKKVLGLRTQVLQVPRSNAHIPQATSAGRHFGALAVGICHHPGFVRGKMI
jgi:hypothetical protein